MYRVIAVRGTSDYLLVDRTSDDPEYARVLANGTLNPWTYLPSTVARGYWEEATLADGALDALLENATVIHNWEA